MLTLLPKESSICACDSLLKDALLLQLVELLCGSLRLERSKLLVVSGAVLMELQIVADEVLGGLMWRERSGSWVEEGSMKIPSKGIFFSLAFSVFFAKQVLREEGKRKLERKAKAKLASGSFYPFSVYGAPHEVVEEEDI